jgi:hypothetical protein
MDEGPRRVHGGVHGGPRPIGALVPALSRAAFRKHGAGAGQVMLDWPAIVGPALAAVTAPQRVAAGTLTIACAGPIAMELRYMAQELIERINVHTGAPTVKALRFRQVGAVERPLPPPPPRRAVAAAEAAVADFPPGPLRDALAALGGRVMAGKR